MGRQNRTRSLLAFREALPGVRVRQRKDSILRILSMLVRSAQSLLNLEGDRARSKQVGGAGSPGPVGRRFERHGSPFHGGVEVVVAMYALEAERGGGIMARSIENDGEGGERNDRHSLVGERRVGAPDLFDPADGGFEIAHGKVNMVQGHLYFPPPGFPLFPLI